MRQVVDVETAGGHVGSDEELKVADAELLHHIVTLCLRELAVQRIGIVAVADQLVGDLLRLLARAAEDDPVDVGVVVGDTLEGKVLVPRRYDVVVVLDVGVALVLRPDDDLLGLVHVGGSDGADFAGHGRGEE